MTAVALSVGGDFILLLLGQRDHLDSEMLVPVTPVQADRRPRELPYGDIDHPCIPAVVLYRPGRHGAPHARSTWWKTPDTRRSRRWMPPKPSPFWNPDPDVALMCTDIQMPGQMDGVGLAHAVHERWPRYQDHRGIGDNWTCRTSIFPPAAGSRQAAQCRGSDSRNARHDRQRLRRQCFSRRIRPQSA